MHFFFFLMEKALRYCILKTIIAKPYAVFLGPLHRS